MDRRRFLAVSGSMAVAPALAQAPTAAVVKASTDDGLFKAVNFYDDGLSLTSREYAVLLERMTSTGAGIAADNYSNGGLIAELESRFAQKLGKQAAMFVPTGTLANHLALRKLAGADRRVLVQAESHFYNDSGDCGDILSGLNLVPLAEGRSTITVEEAGAWVDRSAGGRVPIKVGVISIESPVRRRDHEMADYDELVRLSRYARGAGIRLHLDGARLFNLPYHSGRSLQEHTSLFDTVFVSLWKHFNGASGAILAGDKDFIDGLYHTRRMFGGSLPQAWPAVAVAAQYLDSYEADYARAWQATDRVIALLGHDRRFKLRKLPAGTSRYFMAVTGDAPAFRDRARTRGLLLSRPHPQTGEFAMQVNPSVLRASPETIAQGLLDAANG